jgi:hypothetical protein
MILHLNISVIYLDISIINYINSVLTILIVYMCV